MNVIMNSTNQFEMSVHGVEQAKPNDQFLGERGRFCQGLKFMWENTKHLLPCVILIIDS